MPTLSILDSEIHYRDAGAGVPFVFIHGNPASSYVWRNVMPNIGAPARTLAPDLIGMGGSGKPAIPYRFADHARYLDAWFDALDLDGVVLVGHDWGGALAMDWAARHPGRIRGIVLMETILRPLTWDDFPASHRARYETLRAPGTGEAKVLGENFFIEQALKLTVRTGLSPEDHDVYRQPYPTAESRKPLLAWPREMPIEGTPADTIKRIEAYDEWLASTPAVPKLLLAFDGDEGTLMIGPRLIDWAIQNMASLEIEGCGPAAHVCPEDQPLAIAQAIRSWADRHQLR
jgi:haloalkane dehalogenase